MKQHFYCFLLLFSFCTFANVFKAKSQNWSLTGNKGTAPSSNFLGTKDAKALVLRTNNVERLRINSDGLIGIGTTTPHGTLNIVSGTPASLDSTSGYLVIGNTDKVNLVVDYNKLQARSNQQAATFNINKLGGTTNIGNLTNSTTGLQVYGDNYGIQVQTSGIGINVSSTGTGGYFSGASYGTYAYSSGYIGAYVASASSEAAAYNVETASGFGSYNYSETYNGIYARTNNTDNAFAAYFIGNTYSSGNYETSDSTLKQNITDVTSAMSIISQLKPKHYNFRQDGNYKLMNLPKGQHYGLIAQDVEKIMPAAVKAADFRVDDATPDVSNSANADHLLTQTVAKQKTGEVINFKAVNYTEFIPIIIKGMQEMNAAKDSALKLQQQINADLQNQINQLKAMIVSSAGSNQSASVSSASLQQNIPNPFSSSTTIGYNLPAAYSSASILVTDAKGVVLKQISLNSKGKGNVQFDASTLAAGAYRYSLYVDGRMIDSKQMISSK